MLDTREPVRREALGTESGGDVPREPQVVLARGPSDGEPGLGREAFVHLDEIDAAARERVHGPARVGGTLDQGQSRVRGERVLAVQREPGHDECRTARGMRAHSLSQRQRRVQGSAHHPRSRDAPVQQLCGGSGIAQVHVHVPQPGDDEPCGAIELCGAARRDNARGGVDLHDSSAIDHDRPIREQRTVGDVDDGDVRDDKAGALWLGARAEDKPSQSADHHGDHAFAYGFWTRVTIVASATAIGAVNRGS
jgi:hypothetical protein